MKNIVLAFSGGLDTSFCAAYLQRQCGYQVHAVTVQTGGFSPEDLQAISVRAQALQVASFKILDLTQQYYERCIRFLIFGNVLKNSSYPLSVSAERMLQAISIAQYAKEIGADAIAHGSTGAGNDQVRFDMAFHGLLPGIDIITPIRDLRLSREAEIEWLSKQGFDLDFSKAQYSINKGLWGTSVGGKETLGSKEYLPEAAWPTPCTATTATALSLRFEKGELYALNGVVGDPVTLIQQLQALAQPYGIGRDIHVGDTIIGIKGRVGFEAAAPIIIIKAHHLLEKHTLSKWQLYWKEQLAGWYGHWLHEGQFLDPTMRNIECFLEDTQHTVCGTVFIRLEQKHFTLTGIESEHDLMNPQFGSYGEMNNTWDGNDVRGFAKIFGNGVSIFHRVNHKNDDELKNAKL
ncbi:MAG: argininosuccinate synthase [Bacteroidetes bacterium]|nr:argininosuccinate synthase [Bacteroidota bacterium]